ncbi:MAG: PD40 domain-containing protein [Anaerolineales bacterium]|nr:PD40 domain-containing protein [Anaerolineales bacterium]
MRTRFFEATSLLFLAAALCACGPEAASEATISPTEESAATREASPTSTFTPTAVPTLPPASPMPGLVFADADSMKRMIGPYLVDADGETVQLADKPDPALSPDRKQVLYSGDGDVWLLDLDTGKTRNLTRTKDRMEQQYQWWPARPDLIVFHFQYAEDLGPAAGYLATMKPDGTNVLLLDEEFQSFSPAALSPDGQAIAFDRAGEPWIYHYLAGKMPALPATFTGYKNAANPAWSPDSRKIAWQLFGLPGGQDGSSAVAILDFDTLTVTQLHTYPILGGGIGNRNLAWSPDGRWLAVANPAERTEDKKVSLWVLSPDGTEEHHLGGGDLPVWSPDGSMLLYHTDAGVFAANAGEWIPFPVTLPKTAQVIDWVEIA